MTELLYPWLHSYELSMTEISYPYTYIPSAYVNPNPSPASCPADAVARLPQVPIGTTLNDTPPRNPPNPDSPPSSSSLSHAVIAGIIVCCVLAMLFLVMSSYLFIQMKRRSAHAEPRSKEELLADDVDNEARSLGPPRVGPTIDCRS